MKLEASQYYRITDKSYRALEANQTPFMNLGLWPARSISEAQSNLISTALNFADSFLSVEARAQLQVVELGPGWGGSRRLIADKWPRAGYLGINCSKDQIEYATILNQEFSNTEYRQLFFEDIDDVATANMAIGIESVIHVGDKRELFERLAQFGVERIVLAEICPIERAIFSANPLFDPSLKCTRPVTEYESAFRRAGFEDIQTLDITTSVFSGWSKALNGVDGKTFAGNARVLRQFKESYSELANLADRGMVKYVLMSAARD